MNKSGILLDPNTVLGSILYVGGDDMYYKVKDVAEMVGLSVRMLHHYDKINLLNPDHVTPAGYRQYSDENLEALQQIMFLRELDFSLNDIKDLMRENHYDPIRMLENQKILLEKKVIRLNKIIDTIAMTKEKYIRGEIMSNEERFEGFDVTDFEAHKKQYEEEVKKRWSGSEAFDQSQKRTARYSNEDFKRIQDESNAVYQEIVGLMDKDVSDRRVQELVGSLQAGITKYFYECTDEIFAGLGQLYVDDPRFTKNLDKQGNGFAHYLSEAIAYYVK